MSIKSKNKLISLSDSVKNFAPLDFQSFICSGLRNLSGDALNETMVNFSPNNSSKNIVFPLSRKTGCGKYRPDNFPLKKNQSIVNAVLYGRLSATNAPKKYVLGTGHVKFFANKIGFLYARYTKIWNELAYSGFDLNLEFSPENMNKKIKLAHCDISNNYKSSDADVLLSRNRIIEKIMKKPEFYKWTRRKIPNWLKKN
jgi:hypothetical protein